MNTILNSQYVRCIDNRQFIQMKDEPPTNEEIYGLVVGKVYKRIPDVQVERHGMIRVIDASFGEPGSEQGYMYPVSYFEPLDVENKKLEHLSIQVPAYIKDILHAEAVASDQSISTLIRAWINDRLDLPEQTHAKV